MVQWVIRHCTAPEIDIPIKLFYRGILFTRDTNFLLRAIEPGDTIARRDSRSAKGRFGSLTGFRLRVSDVS
jgi:hypothetical protein